MPHCFEQDTQYVQCDQDIKQIDRDFMDFFQNLFATFTRFTTFLLFSLLLAFFFGIAAHLGRSCLIGLSNLANIRIGWRWAGHGDAAGDDDGQT